METEKRSMWLKQIAESFGMNILRFAEYIGYSRATLYCLASGSGKAGKAHIEMACFKLGVLSERILRNDILSANERHEERLRMIREFEKRVTAEGEDEKTD